MKNSIDTIGNRIRVLTVCTAVPQPTASPRVPWKKNLSYYDVPNRRHYTVGI